MGIVEAIVFGSMTAVLMRFCILLNNLAKSLCGYPVVKQPERELVWSTRFALLSYALALWMITLFWLLACCDIPNAWGWFTLKNVFCWVPVYVLAIAQIAQIIYKAVLE